LSSPVLEIEAQLVERPVVNRMDVGSNPTDLATDFCGPTRDATRCEEDLEGEVAAGRHARFEDEMPCGAGFDSCTFREQMSSRSPGPQLYPTCTTSPSQGRRTMVIFTLLTPVRIRPSVHLATVPWTGTRFCEDRRQRFNSSRWHDRVIPAGRRRCVTTSN
jgi:hypothetical protein